MWRRPPPPPPPPPPASLPAAVLLFAALLLFWAIRVILVFRKRRSARPAGAAPVKTMAVLGSGGHTAEMVRLLEGLNTAKFAPRVYVIARSDIGSQAKIEEFEMGQPRDGVPQVPPPVALLWVPRSREVGQSFATSALTTLHALVYSVWHVFRELPSVVLCNGPGTCIPIIAAALLVRCLGIKYITLVYVESIARVETLSLSGKIARRCVDHFLVQWPQLAAKYPGTRYVPATFKLD